MRVHSLDGRVFEIDEATLSPCEIPKQELERLLGSSGPLPEPLPPGRMPPPPRPPPNVLAAMEKRAAEQNSGGLPVVSDAEPIAQWNPNEWVQVRHLPGQVVIDITHPDMDAQPEAGGHDEQSGEPDHQS